MDPKIQAVVAASATFVAVTLICSIVILFCKSARWEEKRGQPGSRPLTAVTSSGSVSDSISFDPSIERFSLAELVDATGNFSPEGIIGDGSFGFVYRAQLPGGRVVAVKRLDRDAFQGLREFRAEVETLGRIQHENLVKILGCCISGPDRLLIYEYVELGSLDRWIHEAQARVGPPLSWTARVKIIRGIATGLAYLHLHTDNKARIIHRDIKASNVLLDAGFGAHIADFGLARRVSPLQSHVSTQVAGTTGYMPPEYKDGLTGATTKADVYSFGVLMLEVATGLRPNLPIKLEMRKEVGLSTWAQKMVQEGRLMELLDSSMDRAGVEDKEVREYFRVACLCSSENSKDRPDMDEVVALLSYLQ